MKDVASASQCVNSAVEIALAQDEFDALVDFVFNVGPGNFRGSTVLKDLNASDFAAAAAQFEVWDYCAGVVAAGLLRRRTEEAQLFDAGVAPSTGPDGVSADPMAPAADPSTVTA